MPVNWHTCDVSTSRWGSGQYHTREHVTTIILSRTTGTQTAMLWHNNRCLMSMPCCIQALSRCGECIRFGMTFNQCSWIVPTCCPLCARTLIPWLCNDAVLPRLLPIQTVPILSTRTTVYCILVSINVSYRFQLR